MQDIEFTIEQRHALHAAVPRRQAHRRRGDPHRRRHGEGEADRAATTRCCASSPSSSTSSCARRSRRRRRTRAVQRAAPARQGPQRRPRRRDRPHRLQRRGRRSRRGARREGHPRAHRDLARGHPRHGRGRGHPHRARRHDQPRGAGRAPDGQGVRRRLRGARDRLHGRARCASPAATTCCARATTSRSTARTGEVFRGRIATEPSEVVRVLIDRSARPGAGAGLPAVRAAHELGRQGAHASACAPTPTSPTRAPTRSPSAPRASASAAPSTCSSARSKIGADARDDPRRRPSRRARAALAKLLPLQRDDFDGIFRAMDGLPVTIRTLDPPLHEFLPHDDAEPAGARRRARHPGRARARARRGAARVQPDARLPRLPPRHHLSRDHRDAGARHLRGRRARCSEEGIEGPARDHDPAGRPREGARSCRRRSCARVADRGHGGRPACKFTYTVGTMIEVPRGALTADEIAGEAEFFSFGTNDLTQTTLGVSRDDAGRFLVPYVDDRDLPARPVRDDRRGGRRRADAHRRRARAAQTRPRLKIGICGEHGGDPSSVDVLPPRSGSTTSPARRSACRSRGSPRRRRRSAARAGATKRRRQGRSRPPTPTRGAAAACASTACLRSAHSRCRAICRAGTTRRRHPRRPGRAQPLAGDAERRVRGARARLRVRAASACAPATSRAAVAAVRALGPGGRERHGPAQGGGAAARSTR